MRTVIYVALTLVVVGAVVYFATKSPKTSEFIGAWRPVGDGTKK